MRTLPLILSAFAGIALAGCTPKAVLDRKVSADSAIRFSMWRTRIDDDLTLEQRKDLDGALWEFKHRALHGDNPVGIEDADEVVRDQVSGMTVREVLRTGYELKLAGLKAESDSLDDFIRYNADLKPVTGTSAEFLATIHDSQVPRLRAMDEDIENTQRKLDELLGRPHVPRPPRAPLPEPSKVQPRKPAPARGYPTPDPKS
jgi:hypothetical protein